MIENIIVTIMNYIWDNPVESWFILLFSILSGLLIYAIRKLFYYSKHPELCEENEENEKEILFVIEK